MIGGIFTALYAICIVLQSSIFNTIIQMIETKTAGIYTLDNRFFKYSKKVKLFLLKLTLTHNLRERKRVRLLDILLGN